MFRVNATDPDGDPVTLQMASNNTLDAVFNNITGEFRWTPKDLRAIEIRYSVGIHMIHVQYVKTRYTDDDKASYY